MISDFHFVLRIYDKMISKVFVLDLVPFLLRILPFGRDKQNIRIHLIIYDTNGDTNGLDLDVCLYK